MSQLIHKELTYIVRGVLFDVYNHLGPKLPEKFYQKAITFALREQGITCEPEKQFQILYRNQIAGKYRVDHWLENGKLILEIKVAPNIMPIHQAQTLSYLKLTHADLALIANFGTKSLQDQRLPNFICNKIIKFESQPAAANKHILYSKLTAHILESLHRVHFTLGPGFIHRAYRNAMMIELQYQGLSYEHITSIPTYYKHYYIDRQAVQLIKVEGKILLGVFALAILDEMMEIIMKARMTHLKTGLGLLANFYGEKLEIHRILNTT
jgi:GxxExxY protein